MRQLAARLRTAAFRLVARRAGAAMAGMLRLLSRTWRYRIDGVERLARARGSGRGVLYCFWHGRMLELAAAHAGDEVGVLVSAHPDGRAAAGIIEPLGYVPIRGSRLRNPVAGVRAMLRHAASGRDLALTPDAHLRGNRAHPGAVALARLSGHAIVPVAAASRPRKLVASWDRFEIPWPGARVWIRYGEPVTVPREADAEEREGARRLLEEGLRRLHEELEAELSGGPPAEAGRPRPAVAAG